MTIDQVMSQLAAKGSESTKRIFLKHGAKEPFFGVKVADLKVIQRQIKGDQPLALELYATGNGDAQYLAGLIADGRKMSVTQLQAWAEGAGWGMISGTIVPWVASEHPEGFALAARWIDSDQERIAVSGWKTLCALATTLADDRLPVKRFSALLDRAAKTMRSAPDEVRFAMNGFILACGTYVAPLADRAIELARNIGRVEVAPGETTCRVPDAESYILKSRRGAPIAPKRKTVRC